MDFSGRILGRLIGRIVSSLLPDSSGKSNQCWQYTRKAKQAGQEREEIGIPWKLNRIRPPHTKASWPLCITGQSHQVLILVGKFLCGYAVAQLCLSLCNPMDCSLPGLLCPWSFPGKNTGVGCHFLLQGVFLTQGSNPCLLILLHWQVDCVPPCHLGSPIWEDGNSKHRIQGSLSSAGFSMSTALPQGLSPLPILNQKIKGKKVGGVLEKGMFHWLRCS